MAGRQPPNFSFSGLKTAVRRLANSLAPLTDRDVADVCAAFEAAVADCVADRVVFAMTNADASLHGQYGRRLVVAGGVAANRLLRSRLTDVAARCGYSFHAPPIALCGDNGAMIAWVGALRHARHMTDNLDVAARARWPLDAEAVPAIGGGRLGAKA